MNNKHNRVLRIGSLLGIAALLAGFVGISAARADDGYRRDRIDRIETDRRILREDEEHLRHLERRLDDQTLSGDRHGARDTRREMDRTRVDIDHDRHNLDRDLAHHEYHNHE